MSAFAGTKIEESSKVGKVAMSRGTSSMQNSNAIVQSYTEKNGRRYPNISLGNENIQLGRFGREWMDNMHQNHHQRFITLHMLGELESTAQAVELEALERQEHLFQQMLEEKPAPETEDIMEKARHLNSLRLIAEEIVIQKIVLTPR